MLAVLVLAVLVLMLVLLRLWVDVGVVEVVG